MQFISEYVAPWALPKENIPIHLVWEPNFPYDLIEITIPSDLVLKEFFNVAESSEQNNLGQSVYSIKRLKTNNFFGFTVASKTSFDKPHTIKEIKVFFLKDGQITTIKTFKVNIFRPYVTVIDSPNSIEITDADDGKKEPFTITMKLSGFGKIEIRNEISTGGKFVERAQPLYNEIIKKMISSFKNGESGSNRKGIQIDPLYLQKKAQECIDRINLNEFPLDIDSKDIDSLKKWINESSNKEKIIDLLSRQVETLLVDSLLFYFDRYPVDSIEMPQGKPVMFIEKATEEVRIRFHYRDSLLNEYNPINLIISVNDKRKNHNTKLEIPINIKWNIEKINPEGACC